MTRNMGNIDRAVRMVLGACLVVGAVLGAIGPWGWLGLIPLATGLVGTCPAYLPFGFSTCATKK